MEFADLALSWQRTGDGEFPYRSWRDGHELTVRVNDFPAEPLYTLLVDGVAALDLDDWPARWIRPAQVAGAGVLHAWALALESDTSSSPADTVARLGAPGTLEGEPGGGFPLLLHPPPYGLARFAVHALADGSLRSIELDFGPQVDAPTRDDLAGVLGAGTPLPRVHYDDLYVLAFSPGHRRGPWLVDVLARFGEDPGTTNAALRRVGFRRTPQL